MVVVKDESGVKYVEDQHFSLPNVEEGPGALGDLWNCHDSSFVGNLFGSRLGPEHMTPNPRKELDYTLSHIRNSEDKVKNLQVQGEISLELLSGLIKLSGSAEYDKVDESNLKTEKLLCHYHMESFKINLLPASREVMDEYVKNKILKGETRATHIVTGVVIGAEVNASIAITSKDTKSKEGIKGNFAGKLIVGPVSASAKVSLGKIDGDAGSDYDKKIAVTSKPPVTSQPATIEAMFSMIDTFDQVISKETHFVQLGPGITGVPLRYRLAPISEYLNIKAEKLYMQIEDTIQKKLENILFIIKDYQGNNQIKKELLKRDARLDVLLTDANNVFTKKVTAKEKELKELANDQFSKVARILKSYKNGNATSEDLLKTCENFDAEFNVMSILSEIQNLENEAKSNIDKFDYGEAKSIGKLRLFTNISDIQSWMTTGTNIKVLLKTSVKADSHLLFRYHEVCLHPCLKNVDTGIVLPNVCQELSLTIKTRNGEKVYSGNDLPFVFEILLVAMDPNSYISKGCFYYLVSSFRGIQLPLKENADDICELVSVLQPFKDIKILPTSLQTKGYLAREDDTWKFVITLEARATAYEASKKLVAIMERLGPKAGKYVAGTFGIGQYHEAPLLFAFRNGILRAVCLDNLDFQILVSEFENKSSGDKDLTLLSLDNIGISCLYPHRAEYAQHVSSFNSVEYSEKDILPVSGFSTEPNAILEKTKKLIISFFNANPNFTLSAMAALCGDLNSKLDSLLQRKHRWIFSSTRLESGNIHTDLTLLSTDLKDFFSTEHPGTLKLRQSLEVIESLQADETACDDYLTKTINDATWPEEIGKEIKGFVEVPFATKLQSVKSILEENLTARLKDKEQIYVACLTDLVDLITGSSGNSFNIQNVLNKFFLNVVEEIGFYNSELIRSRCSKTVYSAIQNKNYYQLAYCFYQADEQPQVFSIKRTLDKSFIITGPKTAEALMEKMSEQEFNHGQYQAIWTNPKISHIMQNGVESQSFLQNVKNCMCKEGIPVYLHQTIKNALKPYMVQDDDFECPERFTSIQEIHVFFQKVVNSGYLPHNFRKTFRTLLENTTLKSELLKRNALIYWDDNRQVFTDVWGLGTVQESLRRMNDYNDQQAKPSPKRIPKPVYADANHSEKPKDLSEVDGKPKTVRVIEKWHPLIGNPVHQITPEIFLNCQLLQDNSTVKLNPEDKPIKQLLPFLTQRLKMLGIWILQPLNLVEYMPKAKPVEVSNIQGLSARQRLALAKQQTTENVDKTLETKQKATTPLSRIDIITCLANLCTSTIFEDILRIMSQFPVALPLIVPSIEEDKKYKILIPLLQSASFKWETENKKVLHNYLFSSPFQMVVAVRLGNPLKGKPGKSSILNQLMNTEHTFSSRAEPGANFGKPVSLPGFVEFVALSQESCNKSLWNSGISAYYTEGRKEILLLANLHGNCLDFPDIVHVLSKLHSRFMVFLMPQSTEELDANLGALEKLIGQNIPDGDILVVDYTDDDIGGMFEEQNKINTSELIDDSTMKKVRDVLKNTLNREKKIATWNNDWMSGIVDTKIIEVVQKIETPQSQELISFVRPKTCKYIKRSLRLQTSNTRALENFAEYNAIWNKDKNLQKLIYLFVNILWLPLSSRRLALGHLHREISNISSDETAECRSEIISLKDLKRRTLSLEDQEEQLANIEAKLIRSYDLLDKMSLGTEHFFRELGRVYEIAVCEPELPENIAIVGLPRYCAELLLDGTAIEILDGDIGDINTPWFNSICSEIDKIHPNLRVFVVSILGLQSSGKSTLLNALFGCKFAVSIGRCTRGLFMRLLFLEKSLADKYKIDALILIDTEGLGAPEKMMDKNSEKKDRLMATFAMSISNLTLINVLGESLSSLTEILQIVIITMARLDKADMSPDILMVQHVTERDASKTMVGTDAFCSALQEAIALVSQKNVELGTKECKSLDTLVRRVRDGDVLKQFRAYKNGATSNAPPSQEYHEDVVNLYKDILTCCQNSKKATVFTTWHNILPGYWSEVSKEKFSLNFRNLQEMCEHIDRGRKIAMVKEGIDLAFAEHQKNLQNELKVKTTEALQNQTKNWDKDKSKLFEEAEKSLRSVPFDCKSKNGQCKSCSDGKADMDNLYNECRNQNWQLQTESTINTHLIKVRKSTVAELKQKVAAWEVEMGKFSEFEAEINEMLVRKLNLKKDYNEVERKNIAKEIWDELIKKTSDKKTVQSVTERIKDQVNKDYPNVKRSDIANAFNMPYYQELPHPEPEKSGFKQRVKSAFGYNGFDFNSQKRYEVQEFLSSLPQKILLEKNEEKFNDWMIKRLFTETENYLIDFSANNKINLSAEFKLAVHLNGIRCFSIFMNRKEKIWKTKYDPLCILLNKKEDYLKAIDTRLEFGFDLDGEGRIMAEILLKAIRIKGQAAGNRKNVDVVKSQTWVINSENIRLKFFSVLAREVESGNFTSALNYFRDPSGNTFENWFTTEVNSLTKSEGEKEFRDIVDHEFENVHQEISRQKSCNSIKDFVEGYIAPVDGVQYKCGMKFDDSSDLVMLNKSILQTLEKGKPSLVQDIIIRDPSEEPMIMNRLGCTAKCYICSGMCWGERGHSDNAGETAKHHTAHQPAGLGRTHNRETSELRCYTCDTVKDDSHWYLDGSDDLVLWRDALANHHKMKYWNFSRHHKILFNDLMRYFFVKLHVSIAQQSSLQPATDHDLASMGFYSLQLQPILAQINSVI